mgnify:CR=1 FL=1
MRSIYFTAIFSFLFLFGCANSSSHFQSVINSKVDVNENTTVVLATDFISFINKYYPPAKTTFLIDPIQKSSNFLKNMDNELRKNGYAVTFNKEDTVAIPLAWKVDFVTQNVVIVLFNVGESTLTRQYVFDAESKAYLPKTNYTIRDMTNKYYDEPDIPILEK